MSKIQELESQLKEARKDQIFCNFVSPGTFFNEQTSVEVNSQDIVWACDEAKKINERYNAKPYGFIFRDGNGKYLSDFYYITGQIKKYEDIPDTEENYILKGNMGRNNPIIIENNNSFKFSGSFEESHVVLDWDGNIVRRGNDKDLVEYSKNFNKD